MSKIDKIIKIAFSNADGKTKRKRLSKLNLSEKEIKSIEDKYKKIVKDGIKKYDFNGMPMIAGKTDIPSNFGGIGIPLAFKTTNFINKRKEELMRNLSSTMKIESVIEEASKEITGLYTIVVKDGNTSRRFTFQSHKIDSLRKELLKRYGSKIVTKIVSAIKKAESNGTLKFFAKDDAVDFEINGDKVKSVFRKEPVIVESLKELKLYLDKEKQEAPEWANYAVRTKDGRWFWQAEKDAKNSKKKWTGYEDRNGNQTVTVSVNNFNEDVLDEANIEIKDKNASRITVDGKPFNGSLGDLKAQYPKHFAALRMKMKNDGKSLANFGGDDPKVDIVAKADGTIAVNYDA